VFIVNQAFPIAHLAQIQEAESGAGREKKKTRQNLYTEEKDMSFAFPIRRLLFRITKLLASIVITFWAGWLS
jgi:hypothetical protein